MSLEAIHGQERTSHMIRVVLTRLSLGQKFYIFKTRVLVWLGVVKKSASHCFPCSFCMRSYTLIVYSRSGMTAFVIDSSFAYVHRTLALVDNCCWYFKVSLIPQRYISVASELWRTVYVCHPVRLHAAKQS